MFLLFRVYFCFGFVFKLFALHASTWDHCHCSWDTWRSWSACSEICGGGIQNRSRRVWHDDNDECNSFDICASVDEAIEYRTCNVNCYNGGLFKRNNSRSNGACECPKGSTGACCDAVTCGPPGSIQHGSYTGDKYTYNHHVLYTCDDDYSMSDPTAAKRTCTEHGYWTGNTPVCIYSSSCDSNPCMNRAPCLNLLDDYHCTCLQEWTGKQCEVEIIPSRQSVENRTARTPKMTDTIRNKVHTDDIVNIVVGVAVSGTLLVLTVLGVLVVRAHLSKRIVNGRNYRDTELQSVSNNVTLPGKHGGVDSSPI